MTKKPPAPPLPLPLDPSVYTESDFYSGQGMLTTIWGPGQWHFLHTMSFNYPIKPTNKDKLHYKAYILSLVHVLPCKYCRDNLQKNFKKLPLTMDKLQNRHTFSRYIYDLHEIVNTMLKKKSNLTYEQIRERYEHFRARCSSSSTKKKRDLIKNKSKGKGKELGCTEPLIGEKAKCVLHIVPQKTKCQTFKIDSRCTKKRRLTAKS